jgi:hypothetical protein
VQHTLLGLGLCVFIVACGDDSSSASSGGSGGTGASASTSSGAGGGTSSTSGASGTGGSGGGSTLPSYASFHLNYTQTKDWSKCAERDFVIFDLFDTPAADISQCEAMGARMLCYVSSQYEAWRPDAASFGALGEELDGWPGEYWVDPDDPQNLAVLVARLDLAVSKGCNGIDLDNVDRDGHEAYVAAIFTEARSRGLLVSQKNAVDKIDLFFDLVDLYQNEECQHYAECGAYATLGRPVYNIEYTPCQTLPYLYSHRKDVEAMDAWEGACSP